LQNDFALYHAVAIKHPLKRCGSMHTQRQKPGDFALLNESFNQESFPIG
jgi:hypothetical protein